MARFSWEELFRTFASRRWRWPILLSAAALLIASVACLPLLKKDTSIAAFVSKTDPAIVYSDKVSSIFGLRAPLAIAILAKPGGSVFEPETLADVAWLTDALKKTPNVDPERVRSLASVTRFAANGDEFSVEPLMAEPPQTMADARAVETAARSMQPYRGLLFAHDGSATLILADMLNEKLGAQTYEKIRALAGQVPYPRNVYVAGVGAESGYLSDYLNRDTIKMVPLSVIATLLVMALAFRTFTGVTLPFMIVAPSVVGTIAVMALSGVPYFVITNALPSILIAMAVTDAIHVMSFYYRERARDPNAERSTLAARAITQVWRPIVLTELTAVIGFLANALTSSTPPMIWFSVFAIIGVTASLIGTLFLIPAGFAAFGRGQSPPFIKNRNGQANDTSVHVVRAISKSALSHPIGTVLIGVAIAAIGVIGITRIHVDSDLTQQFRSSEPIAIADRVINQRFDGTSYLDVVIETNATDGMTDPARLAKVDALQSYLETLPHVGGVASIIDYLKQLNMALHSNDPAHFALPATSDAVAQELLLLTSGGNPAEWSDKIDINQSRILVRAYVNSGHYTAARVIVEAAQSYIDQHMQSGDMSVHLAGSVVIAHSWLHSLAHEHIWSVVITLLLVFLVDAVLFRSLALGLLTLTPVIAAILLIYSAMGFLGIPLDAATSMFAAISIGLGVDFAIYTVNWICRYMEADGLSLDAAVERIFPNSGRAQFFNFAVFFVAFGVVGVSELPAMQRFGLLVALAILASFVSAITLIPAIMKLCRFQPRAAQSAAGSPANSALREESV